jgi:hypothetical protein
MFSKLFKLVFVITAYSPILIIWWVVGVFTFIDEDGKTQINKLTDISLSTLTNRFWLVIVFILLLVFCWYLLRLAYSRLTKNHIEVKSIKSSDFNMTTLLISYFLPCIEFYKKDTLFIVAWVVVLFLIILINKNSYFYNPLLKLFGYRYYEISTKKEVSFTMISKRKLINPKDINTYIQLTDYVILNTN